jgi:hypothetical protein
MTEVDFGNVRLFIHFTVNICPREDAHENRLKDANGSNRRESLSKISQQILFSALRIKNL